jgi:GT2 family glycosyltransferase
MNAPASFVYSAVNLETDYNMPQPTVAVIIPTRNRIDSLKRLLSQIVPYVSAHPECSVVVSDDGDALETRSALTGDLSLVQVLQGPRRGPASNRNHGAAHSKGELLIFLDDDCVPEENLLGEYRAAAVEMPLCDVFEGRISILGSSSGFGDAAPANESGGYLWSCNFAIRRATFEQIGGFDERFPFATMEDVDLRFRLAERAQISFLPQARVFHGYEERFGWRVAQHHALSLLLYNHIHGPRRTKNTPMYFVRNGLGIMFANARGALRSCDSRHRLQLLFVIWINIQLLLLTMLWKYRASLAPWLYKPCCSKCEFILKSLRQG